MATLLGQWLNPRERKCLWVWTSGLDFRGLASARNRYSALTWEIDRLLLVDDDEECCNSLLERLIIAGSESGVRKIFLRLPEDSPLTESVKKAGFLSYVTESLYGINEGEVASETGISPLTPRLKQIGDEYRIFELYQKCIPAAVRRVEGMTFNEWQDTKDRTTRKEWVFEHEGTLTGWLNMRDCGGIGQFEVMTSSDEDLQHIVSYTLLSLDNCRQILYLTREFQGEMARILQNYGLNELERYSVFIKELTVRTKDPCLVPLGA